MELSDEDIREWRQLPITMRVFKYFKHVISIAETNLGQGRTLDRSSADQTLANTAHEVGRIEGISEVLNLGRISEWEADTEE